MYCQEYIFSKYFRKNFRKKLYFYVSFFLSPDGRPWLTSATLLDAKCCSNWICLIEEEEMKDDHSPCMTPGVTGLLQACQSKWLLHSHVHPSKSHTSCDSSQHVDDCSGRSRLKLLAIAIGTQNMWCSGWAIILIWLSILVGLHLGGLGLRLAHPSWSTVKESFPRPLIISMSTRSTACGIHAGDTRGH